MTDKELIQQLKTLKAIKPNKDWAIFCKQEIIGNQTPAPVIHRETCRATAAISCLTRAPQFLSDLISSAFFKPAFAFITCFGLILSVFGYAQGTLPGDALYPAKKITEKLRLDLASEQQKPNIQIAMTNQKIQELNQVVQANLGRNLAPAIQEVEQSAQETAKTLEKLTESVKINRTANIAARPADIADIAETQTDLTETEVGQEQTAYVRADSADTAKIKETLAKIQEIESAKQVVETHGVIVETPELDQAVDNCYKTLVEMEIQAMETQILTEEQQVFLVEIQELFTQEQYLQAFEKLLLGQ